MTVERLSAELGSELAELVNDPVTAMDQTRGPAVGGGRFARVVSSAICGRDAAPWVTDFLNAAYYRRSEPERSVDELRFAQCVLNTYWHRKGGRRRLHASDLVAFHRAFGGRRFDTDQSPRGQLSRAELVEGAGALIGDWFAGAFLNDQLRGWGIAFPSAEERARHDPELRSSLVRPGEPNKAMGTTEQLSWRLYPPVQMPSVRRTLDALLEPGCWSDFATEVGRFTPLRSSGLDGQTFELELTAFTAGGWPIFTSALVSVTRLLTADEPQALWDFCDEIEAGLRGCGHHDAVVLPYAATPIAGIELTAQAGHFMGAGHNRLLLYTAHDGTAMLRAAGAWEQMSSRLAREQELAACEAQHALWGEGADLRRSLIGQLALRLEQRS